MQVLWQNYANKMNPFVQINTHSFVCECKHIHTSHVHIVSVSDPISFCEHLHLKMETFVRAVCFGPKNRIVGISFVSRSNVGRRRVAEHPRHSSEGGIVNAQIFRRTQCDRKRGSQLLAGKRETELDYEAFYKCDCGFLE